MESFGQSGITLQAVLQITLSKRLVQPYIVFECVPIASAVTVSTLSEFKHSQSNESGVYKYIYLCIYKYK